ncbi:hypothetical protein [Mesorhizobium sp. M1060]
MALLAVLALAIFSTFTHTRRPGLEQAECHRGANVSDDCDY